MANTKMKEARTREFVAAGLTIATIKGFNKVTREDLATAAGVSPALVSLHMGSMSQIHVKLMRAAIKQKCLRVIAQGLAINDPHARRAPEDLRQLAAESLKG